MMTTWRIAMLALAVGIAAAPAGAGAAGAWWKPRGTTAAEVTGIGYDNDRETACAIAKRNALERTAWRVTEIDACDCAPIDNDGLLRCTVKIRVELDP